MNEIKKIHLGRQSFTISVEAYKALSDYLDNIKRQLGKDEDVAAEVEARMAELLTERGITADKVILPADVDYLKEQLGEPKEFKDDDLDEKTEAADSPKRLYRDTENGTIAGVAAGLANFFQLDVTIIRLLFVVSVFFGGAGLMIYILMWLIVPEAKTASERLQMRGEAVTVESLKGFVDKAAKSETSRKLGRTMTNVAGTTMKIFLAVLGAILAIGAGASLIWLVIAGTFILVDGAQLAGQVIFPIGKQEVTAFVAGLAILANILITVFLAGVAMIRRRSLLPGWGVAALVGLFIAAAGVAGATVPNSVMSTRDRVLAMRHVDKVSLPDFSSADLSGKDVNFVYVPDSKTYLEYRYFGKLDASKLNPKVENGKLNLNIKDLDQNPSCFVFCVYRGRNLEVRIHSPKLTDVNISGDGANIISNNRLHQDKLSLTVGRNSSADFSYAYPKQAVVSDSNDGDRSLVMTLATDASIDDWNRIDGENDEDAITISRADTLNIVSNQSCKASDPFVYVYGRINDLQFNGKSVPSDADKYNELRDRHNANSYNCVKLGFGSDFAPNNTPPLPPVTYPISD